MTQLQKLSLLLFISLSFFACNQQPGDLDPLTEDEAVEILDAELQDVAGGITSEVENIARQLVQVVISGQLCDTMITDNATSSYPGVFIQTTYSSDYSFYMSCGFLNVPQSATFTSNTNFLLTTANIRSDNSSSFSGNATGVNSRPIQLLPDTIEINGDYEKTGTQEIDFGNPKMLTSTFSASLQDFKVGVSSLEIEAGELEFEFFGSTTNYGNFSYPGILTFHGNKTATLTLNRTNYPIDWN